MLSQVVLSAATTVAPSLKNAAFLGPGVLQFLYPKTGVTGPYVLGTGLILYALSKEIYVITTETFTAMSLIGIMVYGIKKYGPSVAAFADKINEQKLAQLEEAKQASIQQIQNAIDMEKSQQALTQKRLYLFDVQRNNIAMQAHTRPLNGYLPLTGLSH
uniref:ATP synthase subunit b n=1 Tax=Mandrillus leucophaeus TaxID=9568 RepID=A0A2K6A403_MANLE